MAGRGTVLEGTIKVMRSVTEDAYKLFTKEHVLISMKCTEEKDYL